jgi:hypothetical protein
MKGFPQSRARRTEAQQAAMTAKSQRNRVKIEAVAFYDSIHGLPPDAAPPDKDGNERGKHYRKCHEYARVAWECFQAGTRPPWKIGRNAIYRRYEAKLREIGVTYLSALQITKPTMVPKRTAPILVPRTHDDRLRQYKEGDMDRALFDYLNGLSDERREKLVKNIDLIADYDEWLARTSKEPAPTAEPKPPLKAAKHVVVHPKLAPVPKPRMREVKTTVLVEKDDHANPAWRKWQEDVAAWAQSGSDGPPPPQPTLRKIEVEEIVVKRVPITDEAAEPAPTPPNTVKRAA